MDHFALPDDSISIALEKKELCRNFMGYTIGKELDVLAFGSSAISKVDNVYAQNHIKLKAYENSVNTGQSWFAKVWLLP